MATEKCTRCGAFYTIAPGKPHTDYCPDCTERITAALRTLRRKRAEVERRLIERESEQ